MLPQPLRSTADEQRTQMVAATACLVVLSALAWHRSGPQNWEGSVTFLATAIHLTAVARAWILLWQPTAFAVETIAVACIAAACGRRRLALSGTLGCLAAATMTQLILKPIIGRRRPPHVAKTLHAVGRIVVGPDGTIRHAHIGALMFPSAHVTAAAAWTVFAWLAFRPRSRSTVRLLTAVPLVTAWAVLATRMHYPLDAAAGLLVGPIVLLATVRAAEALRSQSTSRTTTTRELLVA